MDSLPNRPQPSRPLSETVRAWLQWFGVARLAVSALAILGVGAGGYWLLRAPPTVVESTLPYAKPSVVATSSTVDGGVGGGDSATGTSAAATPPPTVSTLGSVVVYVAGAVAAPGVYRLSAGDRIQQAIEAAGGLAGDADVDAMNLAALVRDGDRVYVPHVGQAVPAVVGATGSGGASASGTDAPPEPVDLNHATADELDALPGIGPATAAAIVAHREQNGPYASVDGLLDVRGIGAAKLEAIRALVRV